jgi:hypothetical protein
VPGHRLLVRNLRASVGPLEIPLLRELLDEQRCLVELLAYKLVQARHQRGPH